MSEVKSHFRIRNGEIEIEYDGSVEDVSKLYKEAFEWLKSSPKTEISKDIGEKKRAISEDKKKGSRGSEIWSPAIDTLIEEGFFKLPNRKTTKDVVKTLEDKALPTQGKSHNISVVLTRKVRRSDLKGTKGPQGWTFWTE